MVCTEDIMLELAEAGNEEKAKHLSYFFKTGKGEYGEGDCFLGVTVPQQRAIAKKYQDCDYSVIKDLLCSPYHEHRMTGLFMLTYKYGKSKKYVQKREYIVDFYLAHREHINNWDLVDLSCYKILGDWLFDKEKEILYELAKSENMWEQRIAMVSCMHFIRQGDFTDAMKIADSLLYHKHDLIHKAVGWLLREIGKKDRKILTDFLASRYKTMPRTMLRYAIEHYPDEIRKQYLKGEI